MGKNFSGGAIAGIAIAGIVGLFIGYKGVKKALVNNTEITISVFVKNNNGPELWQFLLNKDKVDNINVQDKDGWSALIYQAATHLGTVDNMKWLIDNGANINLQDNTGNTPLIYAVVKDDLNKVLLLIDKGADQDIVNNQGNTALSWAEKNNRDTDIIYILKNKQPMTTACPCPASYKLTVENVPKTFQGLPLGLRLCYYEPGADFREAQELAHFKVNLASGLDKPSNLRSIITSIDNFISTNNSETMKTAKRNGKIPKVINWQNCVIFRRFLVSNNAKLGSEYANLFYQGWLFDNAVKNGVLGATAYPLIGVFYPTGAIKQSPKNDQYAPTDGSFNIFEQHIHKGDPYEGHGNREAYVRYLIDSMGYPEDIANAQADSNEADAGSYQYGPDSSRIVIDPNEKFGTAFIICLDLSNSEYPKLMITFLLLIQDETKSPYNLIQKEDFDSILNQTPFIEDKESIKETLINLPRPRVNPLNGGNSNHRRTVKRRQ